jgi:glycolate oxidase iron-sulfur subunit
VWERVTYQDACHLAHGQKIREQPRALLKSIPGIEFVEMRWADRCCGAAGIYSMTHPDLSGRILAEKMESIAAAGAGTVVVTNPGCHMQLLAGAAQHMPQLRVRHLAEILNESYRA